MCGKIYRLGKIPEYVDVHVVEAAVAVAGAAVLARGRGRREDGKQDEELHV